MSDQGSDLSALYFPKELSIADSNCAVCMDDARRPVFCTTCMKMLCFDCMAKCQRENGCGFCRQKVPIEVYNGQRDNFCCIKHSLLLTMICTDCNVCICKLCIGKESEHAQHAFKNIDDIRSDLCKLIGKLKDYSKMVDDVQSILDVGCNIGIGTLQNIHSFGINQSLVKNVRQFLTNIEALKLNELIQNKEDLKKEIEKLMNEIGKSTDQEPQDYYDFNGVTSNLDIASSSSYSMYVTKYNDKHGNVWEIEIFPKHKHFNKPVSYVAIRLALLQGTPGRYEIKVECDQPSIKFQKVIEISLASRSNIYQVWPNLENPREMVLNVELRPTNNRYHIQCARLYREIVDEPSKKEYVEHIFALKSKDGDFSKIKGKSFITDGTGTIWCLTTHANHNKGTKTISAEIEHFDGAVGRFDFYIKIENHNRCANARDVKCTRNFTFGSIIHVKNILSFPADQLNNIG
nr:uncharacterized protein LOC109399476 isoform X1 [Aedes albopictus]